MVSDDIIGVGRVVFHVTRCVARSKDCLHHQTITSAYTMFNVYYPKLLETGSRGDSTPKSLEDNLWDVVIFTLGGCPGALVRLHPAFRPESTFNLCADVARGGHGRKRARATTFVGRHNPLDGFLLHGLCPRRESIFSSRQFGRDQFEFHGGLRFNAFLSGLLMYEWIDNVCGLVRVSPRATFADRVTERCHRWTPEIFGTKVRGTVCGIASALSRMYVSMRSEPLT